MRDLLLATLIVIGFVFVCAAASKLRLPRLFREELAAYRILPAWALWPVAITVPVLELAAGAGVLLPATRTVAAWLLLALLVLFALVVSSALARGLSEIRCACIVGSDRQLGWHLPARNLILASAVGGYLAAAGPGDSAWPAVAGFAVLGLTAALGVVLFEGSRMVRSRHAASA